MMSNDQDEQNYLIDDLDQGNDLQLMTLNPKSPSTETAGAPSRGLQLQNIINNKRITFI